MRLLILALILTACGQPQVESKEEPTTAAPKRPSKTVTMSRAFCDTLRTDLETDFLILTKTDVLLVVARKLFIFEGEGELTPIENQTLTVDGFCTLTLLDKIENVETVPLPSPSPNLGGCYGWFCN